MQPSSDHVDLIVAEAKSRDTGHAAVIGTDISGQIVYWNDFAWTLYGWSPDDAIGRNVIDVLPTYSTSEEAARIMERLRQGESWVGEFIVRSRDGQPIVAHVTDLPVRHGTDVVGVVGVSRAERRSTPSRPLDSI